jgi:hypothetical protein
MQQAFAKKGTPVEIILPDNLDGFECVVPGRYYDVRPINAIIGDRRTYNSYSIDWLKYNNYTVKGIIECRYINLDVPHVNENRKPLSPNLEYTKRFLLAGARGSTTQRHLRMRRLGASYGESGKFFCRDADNVDASGAIVLVGAKYETRGLGVKCKLCGFENCSACEYLYCSSATIPNLS